MAAQKGLSVLLKQASTTMAGLRTKSMSINHETVDVTNADTSSRWRQLLAQAGVRSFSMSGSGILDSGTALDTINGLAVDGSANAWSIVVPGLGTFAGDMIITSYEIGGEHNAEVTVDITIESAGDITYTAEA